MTAPKKKREEKGVVFEGGETGNNANPLKIAMRIHAVK